MRIEQQFSTKSISTSPIKVLARFKRLVFSSSVIEFFIGYMEVER